MLHIFFGNILVAYRYFVKLRNGISQTRSKSQLLGGIIGIGTAASKNDGKKTTGFGFRHFRVFQLILFEERFEIICWIAERHSNVTWKYWKQSIVRVCGIFEFYNKPVIKVKMSKSKSSHKGPFFRSVSPFRKLHVRVPSIDPLSILTYGRIETSTTKKKILAKNLQSIS